MKSISTIIIRLHYTEETLAEPLAEQSITSNGNKYHPELLNTQKCWNTEINTVHSLKNGSIFFEDIENETESEVSIKINV